MPNIFEKLKQIQEDRYKDKIKKHPYPTKVKFHLGSFLDAINGFIWTLKTQPNFAVEIIALILILYLYLFLILMGIKVELFDIVLIIFVSGALMTAELFNTSIEALSDEVAKGEYKEFIRISKDTSAAAVLLISILWVVAIIYFVIPKLFDLALYFL